MARVIPSSWASGRLSRASRAPGLVFAAQPEEAIAAAAKAVENDLPGDLIGDMHASEDYRRAMASVYVKRALTKAASRV